MKNIKLRKAVYTSLLLLALTGCGKDKTTENTTETPTHAVVTTEATTEEVIDAVSNQTIAQIIKEYKDTTDPNVKYSDIKVDEYNSPIYVWRYTDENGEMKYVYNYNLNGYNTNYEYVECDGDKMCVVKVNIHKNGENFYVPIAGLLKDGNEVVNIKVTTRDDQGYDHEPIDNYIVVENPTVDKYNEMKNADEYLNAPVKEAAIEKETNDYILLYKNN